ncbi:MAG: hypothetical protein K6E59_05620 [Bacilli bacterium]|nr:hypothetical protein [Bacilli bacterium]
MRNKLRILSIGLLLSGVFGLASCDTVKFALPEAIQSEHVLAVDEDIPHNEIQELFELVVPDDTSTASKVLDKLLLRLAESYFGTFYDTLDNNNQVTGKGLRTIVTNDEDIKTFVNDHSRFQITKSDGTRDTDKEVQGVKDFYNHLITAIEKSFWNNVTNSSYQDRYFFSEKKFYDAQKAAMYDLSNPVNQAYGDLLEDNDHLTQVVGGRNHEYVGDYFGGALFSYLDVYKDYISRSILPNLYRKVIVENYLQRNNYSALGRSHARKVQTITLKNIDDAADATRNLITHYVSHILESTNEAIIAYAQAANPGLSSEDILDSVDELRDLKFLSKLYAGIPEVDATYPEVALAVAEQIYADANWSSDTIVIDGDPEVFYPLTTLGKIYKDYKEISDTRWETSSNTDFTGSGAYTKETGLMLKQREVISKTSVTEGWYTSSGLSELPSSLRSRLFKIQVANDVDSASDTTLRKMDYGWYVQGHYYLSQKGTKDSVSNYPYVVFDSGSSSWVIVRVDEAVKGPKLSQDPESTTSYDYMAAQGLRNGKETQNEIIWTISDMLADSDTYTKAARQEIIENAKISYHDQTVYDYFETNFPDLFD